MATLLLALPAQAAPVVSHVSAAQRAGTKLVDISYDVSAEGFATVAIRIEASSDGGVTWTVPVQTLSGDVGESVAVGAGKTAVWDAAADWTGNASTQMRFRVTADDGFSLIPGGSFTMGRTSGDTDSDAPPVNVTVSSFYMQKTETTKAQWDEVRAWAVNHGYTDLSIGAGKAANHPVQTVSWFDSVKWCNARSEKEGLEPCYTVGGAVMRTGTTAPEVNWTATGYRLPTEAEWEKAARGGQDGLRFPWGDLISHDQANYKGGWYIYDQSPRDLFHPFFSIGEKPYTGPAASFQANYYGLFDMAGNVSEWCWDWYGANYYQSHNIPDPRGPVSQAGGDGRVLRGGSWGSTSAGARCSNRSYFTGGMIIGSYGFRVARSLINEEFSEIPSGPFIMGRTSGDTDSNAPPVTVSVSGFSMQRTETTKSLWDEVRNWALSHGYSDLPEGGGKAADHPVHSVNWFDVVKWCNARSEKEGLIPCYKTSGIPMRTGTTEPTCDWSASGYRLPTEAEWEKAARGGVEGKRFPWGDVISQANANYYGGTGAMPYHINNTGFHPLFYNGTFPVTGPAASFKSNGYGLYDVCGNVMEWCFDWMDNLYYLENAVDPKGPGSGTFKILRGGYWDSYADHVRLAYRGGKDPQMIQGSTFHQTGIGFRSARSLPGANSFAISADTEVASLLQSISFAPIPDKITTDSVTLTATGGGSGNPVTFVVTDGPGVITDGVLTFTTSGTVTVSASQAGNATYLAAEDVSRTFAVTKATAPVTLASMAQTYNGTPRVATATTDPADLPVVFTYDGASSPPTNAGSYAVVATINDLIYQGSATGTLEIGKAAQAISFAAISDKLTTDSVNLTATGGDSGNPVTFAVTSGPGVITNNVLTFTTSGSVTITASQAGNANYLAAEDVSRTFTVTKAPASIQFADLLQIDNGLPRWVSSMMEPVSLPFDVRYAGSETAPSLPGVYAVTATLDDPIYAGSGSATLTILGLSGRGQRITSGSSTILEANGTDFGRVGIGRVATQTFTITNPGSEPVALTGEPLVEILGEQAGDFQISVPPAAEIPAGGRVSFEVRLAPTQPGDRRAVVQLACDALANGPITFAVGGLGALPTLLAQTITFNLPSTLYLSQSPVSLIATASSGLPVTLTVLEGPATLTDGELQVTEPGKIRIEARQAGGGNFAAAKPVVRTLTVKADPTGLTLADLTQTYNGAPRPITVLGTEEEATVTYLINKEPSDQPPTNAGSYPVTVTAGPVTKTGTLMIARAPLLVQVTDQRKLVGEANPTFTAELSGFIGEDDENTVLFRPISITTKAKVDSPPGLYPITSSGGAAANYTLIHRPGTLVVEGHVGTFEALLRDPDTGLPAGLLKLTVPSTGQSLTANLALAGEAKPIPLAGPLELDPETRVASAQVSRVINKTDTYQLDLTLSLFGELVVQVRKNEELIAQVDDGTRLRDPVKGEAVPQAGAYTAVLEREAAEAAPSAPGWATAKLDAAGVMALAGRLADGTVFTASLPNDVSGGYRLFVQPYKRAGAHLAGAWALTEHPEVEGAWQARGVDLTWVKSPNEKDLGYRAGFGPLTVALEMDAWQPASKTVTLAQLLGTEELEVSYDPTGSPSEGLLPSLVALDRSNSLLVLAPVTNPVNLRKWKAKVNGATGAYSGSFELLDLSQKRTVNFTGVLRQAADAEDDGLQGRGLFILPPLKGAVTTETTTGRMEFRRVE